MTTEVNIITKESIKPSSPTPPHLRTFDLSFLDQISPPFYVPILLFYANNGDKKMGSLNIRGRLKTSLPEILTCFYPVAGRIKENYIIECNDDGVHYVEATVNTQLSDVIAEPSVDVLKTFLPCDASGLRPESGPLLAIQVNVFDCEGIVISVCMAHEIADCSSIASFINCWAIKVCNGYQVLHPMSSVSSVFPQRDLLWFKPSSWVHKGNLVTKRFVFDSAKIALLRAKASNISYVTNPSRVVALSALMWKSYMEMSKQKEDHVKAYAALHTVNLRGKIFPPEYPVEGHKNTFGNVFSTTMACEEAEGRKELHILVGKLRDAIKGMDDDFVKRMQRGDEYLKGLLVEMEKILKGEMELMIFTSWCWFPLYEADFGLGKPIWVSSTGMHMKNTVIFMDTKAGDGIEAVVTMVEEDMAEFEQNEELLSFVSKGLK